MCAWLRRVAATCFAVLSCLMCSSAHAGNNAGGTIQLSWDGAGQITDFETMPATPFPLYARISGAPDIRQLAIYLKWFPFDSLGTSYNVVPSSPDLTCGGTSPVPPAVGGFDGDSSYAWRIVYSPTTTERTCLQYSVSGVPGLGPADFVVALARVRDSLGQIDTLTVAGSATIFGGTSTVSLVAVEPHEAKAGAPIALTLRGRNFEPGALVAFDGPGIHVAGSSVTVVDRNTLLVTLPTPNAPGTMLNAAVTLPSGVRGELNQALAVTSLLASTPASINAAPSNDPAAYRTFDLYSDRTSTVGVVDHLGAPAGSYPSSLTSDALIVPRAPGSVDTVGLFRSRPYDAMYFETNGTQPQTYAVYPLNPPRYLTSLGFLATGVNIYNSTGAFNDNGKALIRATVTYADGDTIQTLHVGNHVRDYFNSGNLTCGAMSHPLFITRPSDPLSGYIFEGGNYFYDVQEQRLPKAKRSKRVASIRVDGVLLDHFCSSFVPHIYAGSRLSGLSAWPNFKLTKASGADSVVRQSQTTGHAHGGYLFGTRIVGTRRKTDVTACKVASLAMAYTHAGFNCSVDSLNAHLQRSQGYKPDQVAIVGTVSPTGSTITYTATGATTLAAGDSFVVERGTYTNPLATYVVTSAGRHGQASRVASHSATIPVTDDAGRVYWNTIPRRADRYTNNPRLRSVEVPAGQLAAQVESLLVRDVPVQLNVGPRGGHWVVADGWTSSFRPGGGARGTYWIKDPFNPRNYTKLIEGQYQNTFIAARYVVPTILGPLETPNGVTSGTPGLTILASGARRLEVVDPLGRHMLRDAATGEVLSEIPEASIEGVMSEHDNGGDLDDPLTGYDVDIPTAIDGNYTIRTYVDDGLSMSASGYDDNGVFASATALDTTVGSVGSQYSLQYSGAGGSVVVTYGGSVGVETVGESPGFLRVGRNPTSGPVMFSLAGSGPGVDAIEVFDVRGRRVDVIDIGNGGRAQMVSWDWRSRNCGPGVYLARLRSQGKVVRFVVLK